jgi:DNA-binding NtrC family response regulator
MKNIKVIVVDDNKDFLEILNDKLSRVFLQVNCFSEPKDSIAYLQKTAADVVLIDIRMPHMDGIELLAELKKIQPSIEAVMLTSEATVETAIRSLKSGAYDYLIKTANNDELQLIIEKAFEKKVLTEQNILLKQELSRKTDKYKIVGKSKKISDILDLIRKAADENVPVLIQGESGTGKELAAHALHDNSKRQGKPFIVVDCGSLQDTLLENELFGHEKGAFTDAYNQKRGLFEMADSGTLFLDEIGEMSKPLQAKLLRVLDTSEFRRIGGMQQIKVDVRVIVATNRVLVDEVKKGNFREDLFYPNILFKTRESVTNKILN